MNTFKLIIDIIFEILLYIFKYKDYDNFIITIIRKIGEYNIIFIKIFQWIWINTNNNSYITQNIENEIHSFTNNTPYNESDIDYKSLLHLYKLAEENSDILQIDSIEPINTGSISLVFRGKLNNKNIAIKILRKNITEKIEKGINFLIKLEKIIYYIPIINYYVSIKMFENNKEHIINQINFISESENIMLFYKKFKTNKFVLIPQVYDKYTKQNNNIILMDYINGKYLYELDLDELDLFFIPFYKFIINSIFHKKIFHSDLHQGNILFYKETIGDKQIYKVGIIDFGMVAKLNTNEIDFIYVWLNAIYNEKFKDMIEYIKNPNNVSNIFDNFEKINSCTEVLEKLYEEKKLFNNIEKTDIIIENIYLFLNVLKNFNCKFSHRYNFFVLSLLPIFSILIKLGPRIKKKNIIKEILQKMQSNDLLD
jgi:predicted unusual protein kinase regulating ubiquinone biosynthesis (AarF/ABC1/UbiB family)